jgi:hypothetical protein
MGPSFDGLFYAIIGKLYTWLFIKILSGLNFSGNNY